MLSACAAFALAACAQNGRTLEIPPLTDPPPDGGAPPVVPDGAVLCAEASECNDGVECTRDLCATGGYCINATDASRCSDDVFCNGIEVCDRFDGCKESSVAPRCDDGDVCTVDACDEANKRCAHAPRDFDDDGEVDWHCVGGTDCDDFDATRGAESLESCADGVDNDCDDTVDEQSCGELAHDRCDDALDIGAGGVFLVPVRGARHDYALGCGPDNGRDVAFRFELSEPQDVTLNARGVLASGDDEIATLSVRDECANVDSEIDCRRGFPSELRMRALPAGVHHVLAHAELAGELLLDARFDPPTDLPENDACEGALDVSEGGHFADSFVDVRDDLELTCGFAGAAELVYSLTLTEERDLELAAVSVTGERMAIAVRSACEVNSAAASMRCMSDAPAQGVLRSVPAGTYFIVVEGPASREVDFSLDVAVLPPTETPAGEGCAHAIDLPLDEKTDGTFAGRQDLLDVRCGCPECGLFLRDVVYRLELPERTDLRIELEGADARMHYALLDDCESPQTPLECGDGTPVEDRLRNLDSGERFLVVESLGAIGFMVLAEALPPTVPLEVSGNGVCDLATEVPETGGVFLGDTRGEDNDYGARCGDGTQSSDAAFHLRLTQPARVTASLSAGFDTVLYQFLDAGDGMPCLSFTDRACDDDTGGGTDSLLEEELPAGDYFYIVDGYGFGNEGPYVLDISVAAD